MYIQALEQDNIENLRLVRFNGQRGNLGAVYRDLRKLVKKEKLN